MDVTAQQRSFFAWKLKIGSAHRTHHWVEGGGAGGSARACDERDCWGLAWLG